MGTSVNQIGEIRSSSEQRVSTRKRISAPLPIELLPGKEVWLHDLGEGGLSVSGSSQLETGTSTYIRFQFPETNSLIDAAGVIAWTDLSGRAGVRFTHLEPDSTAALRRWLSRDRDDEASASIQPKDAALAGNIASLNEISELQATISSQELDATDALDLIVRRMLELTRATGAAIALRQDENVVCRASAGNAPDVGVTLSSSSLTGECFRTGAIVLLNDSETDGRVNSELCRQLNFRSLLVLPIASGEKVVGIAEVLSPNPRNFEGGDILVLTFLAELIAAVAVPPPEPTNSPILENIDFSTNQLLLDRDAHSVPPEVSAARVEPLADIVPALTIAAGMPAAVDEAVSRLSLGITVPVLTEVPSPEESTRVEATVAPVVAAAPVIVSTSQTLPTPDSSKKISWSTPVVAAAVALLVFAAVLLNFYRRQIAALGPSSNSQIVGGVKPNPAQKQTPDPAAAVPPSLTSVGNAPVVAKPQPTASAGPAGKQRDNVAQPTELQVIQGASARVNSVPDAVAPDAPTLGPLANRNLGVLPSQLVSGSSVVPQLKPVASEGVTGGTILKKVLPHYPEMARRAGVSGDVVLTATITIEGTLRDIKAISGSPLLREEAIAAAKQWRYAPFILGGKPVSSDTRITMNFKR